MGEKHAPNSWPAEGHPRLAAKHLSQAKKSVSRAGCDRGPQIQEDLLVSVRGQAEEGARMDTVTLTLQAGTSRPGCFLPAAN